jgi:hypothetical protein
MFETGVDIRSPLERWMARRGQSRIAAAATTTASARWLRSFAEPSRYMKVYPIILNRQAWFLRPTSNQSLNRSHCAEHAIQIFNSISDQTLYPAFRLPLEEIANLGITILRNRLLRIVLRQFLRRWMFSRFTTVNTTDPITCETPIQKIVVVDWPARKNYVYEAKPFFSNIVTQLTNHDYLFPKPMHPSNMLTNEPFTRDQFFSIKQRLAELGHHHWIWDGFCELHFNIPKFQMVFEKPLRHHILKHVFSKNASDTLTETVIDFIEFQADFNNITSGVPYRLLRWALEYETSHPYVREWRESCYQYYYLSTIDETAGSLTDLYFKTKTLFSRRDPIIDLSRLHSRYVASRVRNQTTPVV